MRFGKAIVLNRCEQESEQEERKRAQGQKEWYRHDAKAYNQMYVIATGLGTVCTALSSEMEFSVNRYSS